MNFCDAGSDEANVPQLFRARVSGNLLETN